LAISQKKYFYKKEEGANQDYFKGDQSAARSPGGFVLSGE
jgi:hypothetical protein